MPVANPLHHQQPYVDGITSSSFARFYPYYLGEHSDPTCRRLHVLGTTAVVTLLAAFAVTTNPRLLLAAPLGESQPPPLL